MAQTQFQQISKVNREGIRGLECQVKEFKDF